MRAALCTLFVALAVTGCEDFVGVVHVGADRAAKAHPINALVGGKPSASTALVLQTCALTLKYEDDPRATVVELEQVAAARHDRAVAVALAEIAFQVAHDEGDPDLYLTSACWAWFALFDKSLGSEIGAYDPRFRLCCDLYNRALGEALKDDTGSLRLLPGDRRVVGGSIDLAVDVRNVRFDRSRLPRLLPSAEYEIRGLANRHRQAGIGTSLIASRLESDPVSTGAYLSKFRCACATCLMRLDGGVDDLAAGRLTGTLELHQPALRRTIVVGDRTIPLEFDMSAAIAYFVADSHLFDFELPDLFGRKDTEDFSGLYLFQPYDRGKIPVVFVHGTSSSLARWAGMCNDLFADPEIATRFQFFFFTYRSGEPVAVSAVRLRTALEHARAEFDPHGTDPAFDDMVVIGHSQGGLLTRHTVVDDSAHARWDAVFNETIEKLDVKPETRALLESIFFSKPVPFVKRAIYICTPHRGSFLADIWLVGLVGDLVHLPQKLVGTSLDIITNNRDALKISLDRVAPSSLIAQRTDNPYMLALASLPVLPDVHQHCIAAIDDDSVPPEGNDGVVAYISAALPGVDSTLVVRDHHSCQNNPLVINEVRRILHEHIAAFEAASKATRP